MKEMKFGKVTNTLNTVLQKLSSSYIDVPQVSPLPEYYQFNYSLSPPKSQSVKEQYEFKSMESFPEVSVKKQTRIPLKVIGIPKQSQTTEDLQSNQLEQVQKVAKERENMLFATKQSLEMVQTELNKLKDFAQKQKKELLECQQANRHFKSENEDLSQKVKERQVQQQKMKEEIYELQNNVGLLRQKNQMLQKKLERKIEKIYIFRKNYYEVRHKNYQKVERLQKLEQKRFSLQISSTLTKFKLQQIENAWFTEKNKQFKFIEMTEGEATQKFGLRKKNFMEKYIQDMIKQEEKHFDMYKSQTVKFQQKITTIQQEGLLHPSNQSQQDFGFTLDSLITDQSEFPESEWIFRSNTMQMAQQSNLLESIQQIEQKEEITFKQPKKRVSRRNPTVANNRSVSYAPKKKQRIQSKTEAYKIGKEAVKSNTPKKQNLKTSQTSYNAGKKHTEKDIVQQKTEKIKPKSEIPVQKPLKKQLPKQIQLQAIQPSSKQTTEQLEEKQVQQISIKQPQVIISPQQTQSLKPKIKKVLDYTKQTPKTKNASIHGSSFHILKTQQLPLPQYSPQPDPNLSQQPKIISLQIPPPRTKSVFSPSSISSIQIFPSDVQKELRKLEKVVFNLDSQLQVSLTPDLDQLFKEYKSNSERLNKKKSYYTSLFLSKSTQYEKIQENFQPYVRQTNRMEGDCIVHASTQSVVHHSVISNSQFIFQSRESSFYPPILVSVFTADELDQIPRNMIQELLQVIRGHQEEVCGLNCSHLQRVKLFKKKNYALRYPIKYTDVKYLNRINA